MGWDDEDSELAVDGGTRAAFGFRFQYVATAETLLEILKQNPDSTSISVIVEPTDYEVDPTGGETEVVDFAVEIDGDVARRVQVKASRRPSKRNPFKHPDARDIFKRFGPTSEQMILTNRPLQTKLVGKTTGRTSDQKGRQRYSVDYPGGGSNQAIVYDSRTVADIKIATIELIRSIRGDNAHGQGVKSAHLLLALVLDRVFDAAAGLKERRVSMDELRQLILTPDTDLAHCLRGFDWGAPLIEVPQVVSAVPRPALLDDVVSAFAESAGVRTPGIVVLAGTTGFGKSTIAADFCHLFRHLYEYVCWIDASTTALIDARIKDLVGADGRDTNDRTARNTAFRNMFSQLGGPFVLVFDGVTDRAVLDDVVPTSGCGLVIVTSTNSTSWWPTSRILTVGSLTHDEAAECFRTYSGITSEAAADAISTIVERLGRVPLATAMAGHYFRNVGEGLAALTPDYFAALDALDDPSARPAGFDRTAFAAVRHSVLQLGKTDAGLDEMARQAQALIYHSAFFAPELIPINMLLQTVHEMMTIDLTQPPKPEVQEQHRRNQVARILRTQTLATRRTYVDQSGTSSAASDTITLHPLVHEILRAIHTGETPVGYLFDLTTNLMATAYGWVIELRTDGEDFAYAQVLTHARYILNLADEMTPPDDHDRQHAYVFDCARIYLRVAIADSFSLRREYSVSLPMQRRILEDAKHLDLSPHAKGQIAKVSMDAVADAHFSGDDDCAMTLAQNSVTAIRAFADLRQTALSGAIVEWTSSIVVVLNEVGTVAAIRIRDQLEEIVSQLPNVIATDNAFKPGLVHRVPPNRVAGEIDRRIQAGDIDGAMELVQHLRSRRPSRDFRLMLTHFEGLCMLHRGRHSDAVQQIQMILAAEKGLFPREALALVVEQQLQGLEQTAATWGDCAAALEGVRAKLIGLRGRLPSRS